MSDHIGQTGFVFLQHRSDHGETRACLVPQKGANVLAMSYQARAWKWPVPVLEPIDIAGASASWPSYGVPILGPTPGRVGQNQNGRFELFGNDYSIDPTRHGFLRNRPWDVVEGSTNYARCETEVTPSSVCSISADFPFHFKAVAEFTLGERRLDHSIRLINTGEVAQPLNVGWHPYFHLPSACAVTIPARSRWELNGEEQPTPTGEIVPVSEEDDFRNGKTILPNDGWDDIFTDLVSPRDPLRCWVEGTDRVLLSDGTYSTLPVRRGVEFRVSPSSQETHPIQDVQLYLPPGRNAISLEPLSSVPDAINLFAKQIPRTGLCLLEPGETRRFEISIWMDY